MNDADVFASGRVQYAMFPIGPGRPLYQRDLNNFQPRVGIAWNAGGRDSSVVRAAFGTYYDRLYQLVVSEASRNVPFAVTGTAVNVPFRPNEPIGINPRTPSVFTVDPNLKNPLVMRWNVSLEQHLGTDTSVSVALVGTRGRDLFMTEDPNFAGAYPQASRPDPRFGDQRILRNLAWSNYRALQVSGDAGTRRTCHSQPLIPGRDTGTSHRRTRSST